MTRGLEFSIAEPLGKRRVLEIDCNDMANVINRAYVIRAQQRLDTEAQRNVLVDGCIDAPGGWGTLTL